MDQNNTTPATSAAASPLPTPGPGPVTTPVPYHPQQQQQQQTQQSMSGHNRTSSVKVVAGYGLHQRLGSGSFATVYKGIKVNPATPGSETVAIKAITRTSEKLTKKVLQNLEIEISILQTYRHRNIVCLQDVQKTERHFYLLLEYCGGGDLQQLIRTRKTGRLSERLTRRLMRDLSAGLKFLWRQELVHRDIKPQNLLLTGALPLDELHDPERTPEQEEARRQANCPSNQFALKIADFGFARHLQTASLAETLCGSPLYMAPEILSHHRYDAKADLWSVGTVLFEMISGRPPFHGENHIDLLRNIQRKAVRLPPEVRVSKACVNLLRLLLNRNPLSRAGFKEFFEACDTFVALGCEGVATTDPGSCKPTRRSSKNLGTIPEDPTGNGNGGGGGGGTDSIMTVQTTTHHTQYPQQQQQQQYNMSSPPMKPVVRNYPVLAPLEPSPPSSGRVINPQQLPSLPSLEQTSVQQHQQQPQLMHQQQQPSQLPQNVELTQYGHQNQQLQQQQQQQQFRNDGSLLQNSSGDDSGFVLVDYGQTNSPGATAIVSNNNNNNNNTFSPSSNTTSPASSNRYNYNANPTLQTPRNDYTVIHSHEAPSSHNPTTTTTTVPKGMLSTSPGTGGLLMGMVGGKRIGYNTNQNYSGIANANNNNSNNPQSYWETQIGAASKLLATSEDVGRRAVSVAHLGDTRAVVALRMALMSESASSVMSVTPMEGVEEEVEGQDDEDADADDISNHGDDSGSTEIMAGHRPTTRAKPRAVSIDNTTMPDANQHKGDDEETEEMPFACVSHENIAEPTPTGSTPSHHLSSPPALGSSSKQSSKQQLHHNQQQQHQQHVIRPTRAMVQAKFKEAFSCYLKALQMLKGAVTAAQNVEKDLEVFMSQQQYLNLEQRNRVQTLQKRCGVTAGWLGGQFTGVLERGDAANIEVSKLESSLSHHQQQQHQQQALQASQTTPSEAHPVTSVEELIYNHSLACGREGAVKQLLGQYEAARSCYRSAGLLAETLLMEPNMDGDDRKVLEGYVDGFAARITELDGLMLQQSRMTGSTVGSSNGGPARRGSGVVSLIGMQPRPPFSTVNIASK